MILADTSKWIDHFRFSDPTLVHLLKEQRLLSHPLIIGELAMGMLKSRGEFLKALSEHEQPALARNDEVLSFVETHALFGKGLSFIDAHLLLSCKLTPGTSLWTTDKRLKEFADKFGVGFQGEPRPS